MTVHQQQRDLAAQRKQDLSDKMHNRRKKESRHHPFVQRHGSDGFPGQADDNINDNNGDGLSSGSSGAAATTIAL